ncbi:MAG: AMP-binding protein [Proteobacteria bacterium]|nr:AMP-binding protein [Pseudomonadota bacterium]
MTGDRYREVALTFTDPRDWVLGRVLEQRARTMPERPYLQWEDTPALTFGETNREVNRLAHGFAAAGVRHGDRVMLFLPNSRDFVLAWFALAKLGAVEVPVNVHYRGPFLRHVAANCGAAIALTSADLLPHLAAVVPELPALRRVYVVGESRDVAAVPAGVDVRAFTELRSDRVEDPGIEVASTDIAAILFTSGTTGPSKGVLMPHAQFYFFAEQGASLVRLGADDVYMNAFPLFHGNAQFLTTYPCLIRGARAVLYERFSASEWIDRIRRHGVTCTNLLGVTMDFVHKQPPRPDDADNALRVIYAVPTAHQILASFMARFGIEACVDAFGQTETGLPLMTPYGVPRPPGAVGMLVDEWYEIRLVDPDTDLDVPPGEMGELVVRHRVPWTLCAGYHENPAATLKAMRNLWWHTGDGMRRDNDGWYYFVDRVNDALRVRGENVSSYEVEQVVLAHPAVAECAATAVRSAVDGGESDIKVSVVLKPGAELAPAALIAFCDERAPYFAVPRYVEYLPALPRTPSEKIQKHLLRKTGVTPATWDRVAAGVRIAREAARSERRGETR